MMSGWANHIEPFKGTRRRMCRIWMRSCQSRPKLALLADDLRERYQYAA